MCACVSVCVCVGGGGGGGSMRKGRGETQVLSSGEVGSLYTPSSRLG